MHDQSKITLSMTLPLVDIEHKGIKSKSMKMKRKGSSNPSSP